MVTEDSAQLSKKDSECNLKKWIPSLGILSYELCERLVDIFDYYLHAMKGNTNAEILLWQRIEMIKILSMLSMDIETLIALLFPLIDTSLVAEEIFRENISYPVIALIHNVHDMAMFYQPKSTNYTYSAYFGKMTSIGQVLLSMADNFCCVVIKLAEFVAYLREVKGVPESHFMLAAENYATISPSENGLDINQFKWELEDYCFRYLYPEEYRHIAKLLHERRIDRENYIEEFVSELQKSITEEGVKAEVYGRPKHIYSIWRKMQKKHLTFNELFDIRAVRIVAEGLQDCYTSLGIIHTHFHHLPNEFDDYVANPKPNGYQSIHTVVLGPGDKTIEIQIRTKKMHKEAELGMAAHWKYKEYTPDRKYFGHIDRISWLCKPITLQ